MTLGTDGFGMSDTRQALREHYGVSQDAIKASVLWAMVDVSLLDRLDAERLCQSISQPGEQHHDGGQV